MSGYETESQAKSPALAESCPAEAAAVAVSTPPATLEELEAGVTTHFEIPTQAAGGIGDTSVSNSGSGPDGGVCPAGREAAMGVGGEASATGFPADWNVVKDEFGNVTVSPPVAADGECGKDVVIGPGSIGPGCDAAGVVAEASSTRPIPEIGHVLCQVCKQPTNSEKQEKISDTPFVFSFNGQPRAIICFECYMNGVIAGARIAAAEKQIPVPPGG